MSNGLNSRNFRCQIVVWTIAAIVGLTVAMVAVGFLGLWVLVGVGGAVVGAVATGLFLSALVCMDFDAVLQERSTDRKDRDKSS